MSRLERALRWACAYEACALWTRRLPTITKVVHGCRRRSFGVYLVSLGAVLSGLGVLAWHLIYEALDQLEES